METTWKTGTYAYLVWVSWGCHSRIPHMGWLKKQRFIFHNLEAVNQIEVLGRFHFFQASSPWFANSGHTDVVLIPELGRSPVTRNGTSLQDSCLGNPMGKGAWRAAVHRVAKRWTWLSNWALSTHSFPLYPHMVCGYVCPILFLFFILFIRLFILYWCIANWQCSDSFKWTLKGLSHTYACIHSSPNSPPIQAATWR